MSASPIQILAVLAIALASGMGVAYWLSEGRSEKFYGYVHPRTTTISAPRGGVIAQISVHSGDSIVPGVPLATLADEGLESRFQSKHGEIASLTAQLQRATAQAELELDLRLREVDDDIFNVQRLAGNYQREKFDFELRKSMLEDSLASNRLAVLGASDQFFTSLSLQGDDEPEERVVTVLRLKVAENGAAVSEAQLEWCEWNKQRLQSLRGRLPDVVRRSAGVDVLAAMLSQARQDLETLNGAREELEIKSTVVGRAGLLRVSPGAAIAPGGPIVDVLDDVERMVVVNVPSAEIMQFSAGGDVRLTFAGHEERAGRIIRIAPQAEIPTGAPGQESFVEVRIEQRGEVWPEVPAGSRVVVRVPAPLWKM